MLYDRFVDTAAAVERRLNLAVDARSSDQAQLSRDLDAFRKASLLQHRQKFQDAFNQQVINAQIGLVGQATKIRDKVQS